MRSSMEPPQGWYGPTSAATAARDRLRFTNSPSKWACIFFVV